MIGVIVAWLVLLVLPAGLLYLLATTDLVQRALEWYFHAATTLCGTGGVCVVFAGFVVPSFALYALLRVSVFRKNKEAALYCTMFAWVLVVVAANLFSRGF